MTDSLANQGTSWTAEEDKRLYDAFAAGVTIPEIARTHMRSTGGIRARVRRLGLVNENYQPIIPLPPFKPSSRLSGQQKSENKAATVVPTHKQDAPVYEEEGLFRKGAIEALKAVTNTTDFRVGTLLHEHFISTRLANCLLKLEIPEQPLA